MEIINFLPLSVYEFTCDAVLVDRILEIVKTLPTVKHPRNSASETDLFYDPELFEWFNSCINEAKENLQIPKDIAIEITGCWSNKSRLMQMHQSHSHANSFMSGLLYLTEDHTGGNTEWKTDNLWWRDFKWISFQNAPEDIKVIRQQYVPKKGKLLLFPAQIPHSVTALADNSIRYSLAFNAFFSGPICATNDGKYRLEIKSKSVAEYHET